MGRGDGPVRGEKIMLDSCFSGATGRSVLPKGARPVGIAIENQLSHHFEGGKT